jgi:hypothetical protein
MFFVQVLAGYLDRFVWAFKCLQDLFFAWLLGLYTAQEHGVQGDCRPANASTSLCMFPWPCNCRRLMTSPMNLQKTYLDELASAGQEPTSPKAS